MPRIEFWTSQTQSRHASDSTAMFSENCKGWGVSGCSVSRYCLGFIWKNTRQN